MITKLKPYRTNIPSGVEWLGDVPEHWEVHKLRSVLTGVTERNRPDLPLLSVVREKGVILRDVTNMDENHNFIPDDLTNYKVVHKGQFAMNKMKAWQGSYGVSQHSGIVSPAYFIFDIHEVTRDYFHIAVRSKAYVPFFAQASDGVRIGQWDLSQARMREITILVPSSAEQTAIVRFLDHADRRIQRYISDKQKLIKLLEEQKQAIIHRAVTRGLNPNVRLKPSGVEWLGDVPEHWEVVGLKFLSRRIQNGATPSTVETRYYETGSIPWYGPSSCRYKEKVDSPVRYLTADAFKEGKARLIHGPALLVIVIGATAGRLALLTEDGSTNQQITSFELNTVLVHPLFILRQARSAEHWLRATASTATIPILDTGVVSRLSVAFPPLPEQTVIVEHLDKTTANIDTAINRARRQIELLSEYHTRLIADVVTGKLDVRDADISASGEVPTLNGIDDLEEKTEPDEVDVMEEIYGDD